ncbi:hypothetical protein A2Y85_02995 [candidate division WOR-3 bacterium RBG_13_43_14]|uniref:Secretion system C-terminal sorting domain-containing protein n=1 Tax=candidate division WOR-3 bacterium RBG_13_43_14 TaxID=1802590 RepID=A0A1F4UBJ2_UNCW3|nr:MAG: hypothetical protein A2Y85_02995 [candidate division WOR-3 bacterium RBG_13_43_14]
MQGNYNKKNKIVNDQFSRVGKRLFINIFLTLNMFAVIHEKNYNWSTEENMNMFLMFLVYMLTSTTTIADNAGIRRGKNYIDDGRTNKQSHFALPAFNGAAVLIDSSGNGYSAWTQTQECLAYNPTIGGLQFVCRGYSIPTGILNVHRTDSIFSYWIHDPAVYNQEYGPARYPHSINSGYLCFPVLPGLMIAMQLGGAIEDIGPGDLDVYRVIGTQVANSNMLFIGCDQNNEIIFRLMTPDLQTPVNQGTIAYDCGLIGFDYNDTLGYIFYCDDSLNIYYRRINASGGFSPESIYNMVWPEPYTINVTLLTQCAVTDSGKPILVFDNLNGEDPTYPCSSKVYVSIASGQPCIEVSNSSHCFYPTITASGNYVIVLFHSARSNSGQDSLAWFDLKAAVSPTQGQTWSNVINLTNMLTSRPGLAQLSKRFAANLGRFYYFYGINMVNNHDPIWHCWRDPQGLDPHAWYVGWHEIETGITEEQKHDVGAQNAMLTAYPNPFSKQTTIHYELRTRNYEEKDKTPTIRIYDASGRLVKQFTQLPNDQLRNYQINWDGKDDSGRDIPPGVYFVKLQGENLADIDKMIKVK